MCVCVCVCGYLLLSLPLPFSLSLYIYIYFYIYKHYRARMFGHFKSWLILQITYFLVDVSYCISPLRVISLHNHYILWYKFWIREEDSRPSPAKKKKKKWPCKQFSATAPIFLKFSENRYI